MQIKMFRIIFLSLIGLLVVSCSQDQTVQNKETDLNSNWILLKDQGHIDTVNFPFSLIETLYKNQYIGDPNYEDDHQKFQIDPSAYSLKKEFYITPESIESNQITFYTSGINGLAEIYINNALIGTSDSYYKQDNILINEFLNGGANIITLKFKHSNAANNHPDFQHGNMHNVAHINIGCLNTFKIVEAKNIYFKKPFLDYSGYKEKTLEAFWNIPVESFKEGNIEIKWAFNGQVYTEEKTIKKGQSLQTFYFPIENPVYWFPYSHGTPHLYKGELSIYSDGELMQKEDLEFGVKHLKWKNNSNQIEFVLNGKSIDVFAIDYNRTNWYTWSSKEETEAYILDLKRLGINCVRVSGKDDYLREDILDLFDREGILVWQDLHYKQLPKTWTIETKVNIQQEMMNLCETYRNHPSVLSLGGKSEDQSDTTKNSGIIHYEIFEQVIPQMVNTFSHLEYIPNASFVWNDEPNNFGTLSMSSYEFLDVWLRNKYKDPFENPWISRMPSEEVALNYYEYVYKTMGQPIDIESMIYYSELRQNTYIDSILAHKRHINPKTIHLPISYGESGPGIHPSITDYFGYYKAVFYTLLKQNAPLSIQKSREGNQISYLLHNNSKEVKTDDLHIRILDRHGKVIDQFSQNIRILPNQSKSILEWAPHLLPSSWRSKQSKCLEIRYADKMERFILNFEEGPIPNPDYKFRVIEKDGGQFLEILSNNYIPYSKIKSYHIGYFSTNFVTLLPEDTLHIPFNSLDTTYPLSVGEIDVFNYYQSFE